MGSWAARRTARLFVQLTPKERAQLEALARRDASTLTAAIVSLITREHAIAVAGGFLSPVTIAPGTDHESDMSRIKAKLRTDERRKLGRDDRARARGAK
jgi:hypothetical protein